MSNFSDRVKKVLNAARTVATENGNDYIGTEHLLISLLRETDGVASAAVSALGVDIDSLVRSIENSISSGGTLSANKGLIPFSQNAKKAVEDAVRIATEMNQKYTGTEHLLLSFFKLEESKAFTILSGVELNYAECEKAIKTITATPDGINVVSGNIELEKKKSKTPFLDNFSRDLTALAKEGKIDPVVGRADEIERVIQILARRKKNNPILLGEPGVGKTAVVEGLALRIVANAVPDILENKRVCALDLAAMVAGTKYRGQFEERIKALMVEIKKNPDVITFIDEIHTMVGAGDSEGGMDAANIFKPALARGELQVVGATTFKEYRESIEKDGALERRFQPVNIEEPSIPEAIEILRGQKNVYEAHHLVSFTDEALEAAVKLSERYMTTRQLPDKALDVIDEAGSRARIKARTAPKIISELNIQIKDLEALKQSLVEEGKFDEAASILDKVDELMKQVLSETELFNKSKEETVVIDDTIITETVSKMINIPITKADDSEIETLLDLENLLRDRVIGQDNALEVVAQSIRRSRAGVHNPKKPIGAFMFLGPTGVGKTELAKALSELVFKTPDSLIRIDMSEYMDKHNVSRLVGAAPGFVGYEEGGQLTEAVRKKPYSVVLFDEIEKAHPDVFNIFLQILDDGHVTDSIGRKVNFKNTIIIMTSNVGSRNLSKGSIGFSSSESITSLNETKVKTEMSKVFNPEFINRLDDAIIFQPLKHEDIVKIVDIHVKEVSKRIAEKGIHIELTSEAKDFIADKSYDPAMGARPLRRNIQKMIEDKIADAMLRKTIKDGDIAMFTVNDNRDGLLIK